MTVISSNFFQSRFQNSITNENQASIFKYNSEAEFFFQNQNPFSWLKASPSTQRKNEDSNETKAPSKNTKTGLVVFPERSISNGLIHENAPYLSSSFLSQKVNKILFV